MNAGADGRMVCKRVGVFGCWWERWRGDGREREMRGGEVDD